MMNSNESVELINIENDQRTKNYSHDHNENSTFNSSHGDKYKTKGFLQELLLSGAERVKRERLEDKDFKLSPEDKIAEYSIEKLLSYWNSNVIKKSAISIAWNGFLNIVRRTFPMICAYLLVFYLFTIFMLLFICEPESYESGQTPAAEQKPTNGTNTSKRQIDGKCQTFIQKQEELIYDERVFNGLLTFLVGFYVSFIVRNWWQNMKVLPFIDSICISLCSYLCVDAELKEEDLEILVNRKRVNVKQFKKDVCRLLLLSWTMSFCRISSRLKRVFHSPKVFYQRGLLTVREYKSLRTSKEDGWLERWATPLLWANKMICNVRKEGTSGTNGIPSVIVKDTTRMEIAILNYQNALEQLNKEYYFNIPGLMHQVISIALYVFFCLGIFAGQNLSIYTNDSNIEEHNTASLIGRLALNFPFYFCAKYMLLIGWIKLAEDLQSPFGDDKYVIFLLNNFILGYINTYLHSKMFEIFFLF